MDEFDREEEFAEHPTAQLAQDKFFFVDDLMLVCDIQESSRGYTEMTAHQRVKGMMWAREKDRSANQLVFVCRKDSETLVATEACSTCPFMGGCFHLNLLELEAETQRILESVM